VGGTHFSGLANYTQTLTSSIFWHSVGRVILFAVVQVPITLLLATLFAVLFDLGLTRFGRSLRLIFFLPFTVPSVVAAVMWSYLLEPQFGPFTRLASTLGFQGTNYFSPNLILLTVIVIVIWEVTGWNMIVIYTALKAVPHEVMEAAAMDGSSLWRAILSVKLPMVRPALVMLVFLNSIGALQLFTEPMMLATFQSQAISFGFTPTIYIYNTAVSSNEYNQAAAAAVLFALLILLISGSFLVFRRRLGGSL
jgi:multiple sugar transport system permease protein